MQFTSNTSRKIKKALVVTCIFCSAIFSFSFIDNYFELSKNLDVFTTVLRELNTYYVDDIKPGTLIKTGIDEMLNTLDPYTEFYAESDIEDYRMMVTGQYGGIGSLIRQKGDYVMITEPYEGFPAQKAGLMAGDLVIAVDGKSVKGKASSDVSKMLKGQANTTVKVTVEREGEKQPFDVSLTREEIKIKNVPYYGVVGNNVGYIKLTGFTENAAKEVKAALLELKEKHKIKALIFDVRDNGGGLLKESVDIVNLFVNKDQEVVTQKGKIKDMNRTHKALYAPIDTTMPVVVLANKNSASASEIVTGSIQDLDRGIVLGQRTFGKGLVQQTIPLTYGTQMKVTTAKYYTPSGRCIQALDYFHKNKDGKAEHVPDSLIREFKTKNGRSVYDGSGIYPDIKLESRIYANITGSLVTKNLMFDYATKYRLTHKTISPAKDFSLAEEDYKGFLAYIADKDYAFTTKSEKTLEDFKKNTESEKYFESIKSDYEDMKAKIDASKKGDLSKYRAEIQEILEGEIVSRYYYQRGRMESSLRNDNEVKEAVKILDNNQLYRDIISGKGSYKTIGKPNDVQAKGKDEDTEDDVQTPSNNKSEKNDPPKEKKKGG